jgi:acetoin:2,6-dichlorophenolindophenol oxidoreductase subunit beta
VNSARPQYFTRAISEALRGAMREDGTVVILGEDVDRSVSGATRGLVEEFGPERVRNSPISEATIAGACVGAAMTGLRPIGDLMYGSFFYVAMDQIVNQAARWQYMSGGHASLPLVFMASMGASSSSAAQHSESPHPMLMNASGLKVVIPSGPYDAKGLMLAAIRDPNPVVYLRDAVLGGTRAPVPEGLYEVPLGVGDVKREGTDVTVVAIASTVGKTLAVADELAASGISLEVIDPRTLVPLDLELILASVARTGRLVVCDNARLTCGAGRDIAARVAAAAWGDLKAAPRVVANADVPVPFSPPLEAAVLVSRRQIRDAVLATLDRVESR